MKQKITKTARKELGSTFHFSQNQKLIISYAINIFRSYKVNNIKKRNIITVKNAQNHLKSQI